MWSDGTALYAGGSDGVCANDMHVYALDATSQTIAGECVRNFTVHNGTAFPIQKIDGQIYFTARSTRSAV